ncbi:hypothetical protein [Emticicia sp. 21SJ11W-3]|uniref:hypothetical protein n=1 Tax=Emticicia sp. 21SJ11W-3 TaxID=2916755 RepID=UPI00209FB6FC|nr:hypothetical protein [Emticicia sp. 21SJ11W-3]UTA66563.1 hypothetical protein MB380_13230 [Emticicia sp. 21SJ11W-3]
MLQATPLNEAGDPGKNTMDEAENAMRTADQDAGIPLPIPAKPRKNALDEAQKAMSDANEYLEKAMKEAQDSLRNAGGY